MSDTLTDPARRDAGPLVSPIAASGAGTDGRSPRLVHLVVVALVALAIGVVVLRPWPIHEPVIYRGDVFQHLAIVQASDDLGSPTVSRDLGAPGSVDWSVFPTGMERLQVLVVRALDAATGDVVVALNLFLLLGPVVTAVVTFAVLRWLRLRPMIAGSAAMLIAFAPAWSEALLGGHLFLLSLYPVSLGLYLSFWVLDRQGSQLRPSNGSLALAASSAAVVALSSAYYATFTVLVIGSLGILASLRRRDARRLIGPAFIAAVIGAVATLSLLPQLADRSDQPSATAVERTVADARRYGLDPLDVLVSRSDHPFQPLASLGRWIDADAQSERVSSVFGLAGLAGLAWTACVAARRWRRPRDRTDGAAVRLATIMVVGLAFAVSGGLGLVLAELGLTQIRAWTRMTAFVYVAAITGLALLAQRALARSTLSPMTAGRLVVVLAALAMVDQGLSSPPRELAARQATEDRGAVEDLTAMLGAGAEVFELPVVSFPDDPGSDRLLAPSLVGSDLHLSGGFFRGGAQDWQVSWCRQPVGPLLRAVASAGFDALLVQSDHHLFDEPAELHDDLVAELGLPAGSSVDGTWTWWDLRPFRDDLIERFDASAVDAAARLATRPIGVSYRGTIDYTTEGRSFVRDGAVVLRRLDGDRRPVQLQLHVAAAPGSDVAVGDRRVDLDDNGEGVARLTVRPDDEVTEVPVRIEGGDRVTVSDVTVLDERSFGDPVLAASRSFREASLGCS